MRQKLATLLLAAVVSACGGDRAPTPEQVEPAPPTASAIPSVAGPRSGEPNLVAGPDGFYMSWIEETGPRRHALRFARWDGTAWTEPGTVIDREGLFVNWADFPSMAILADGTMAAHWLERSGPGPYSYDVRIALSHDDGRSWSEDLIPHRDGVQAEHGFVSMLALDPGIGVVWLDGRATVDGDPMALRFTTVSSDGTLGDEEVIDPSVCDCCQTGAGVTPDGPIVAYRGRTADEIRDILVARRVDGRWTEPRTVHDDGWFIPACPVNGPSVAAAGDRVAVAWFTAAEEDDPLADGSSAHHASGAGEHGRVLVAFSEDRGASFGAPVRVDDGAGMGRVSLAALDGGSVLAAWLERSDDGAEIRVRRVGPTGAGPSAAIAATQAARAAGFPRVARRGDTLLFAWTEPGDPPTVRTAAATVAGANP